MTTFVLAHGAWHGRWCWDSVRTQPGTPGHQAVASTLAVMDSGTEDRAGDITVTTLGFGALRQVSR
jgi:hypothetical protein